MPSGESVASMVRKIIFSRPCLLDSLRLGIINYSALSRVLARELEKNYGRKISESAIKMALIRFTDQRHFRLRFEKNMKEVISESSLSLIDDIVVITVASKILGKIISKLIKVAENARFFQFTQGLYSVTFMVDKASAKHILSIIPREYIELIEKDQAAVMLTSPRQIIYTPGVISYLTFRLSSRGINITQIISCHTDTIFIVNREDALRVYGALREALEEARM